MPNMDARTIDTGDAKAQLANSVAFIEKNLGRSICGTLYSYGGNVRTRNNLCVKPKEHAGKHAQTVSLKEALRHNA